MNRTCGGREREKERPLRKATAVATLLAAGMMGLGIWGVVRLRHAHAPGAAPILTGNQGATRAAPAVSAVAPLGASDGSGLAGGEPPPRRGSVDPRRFEPPPQPAAPLVGSPARQPYLQAIAAGDERGLAAVRQALAAAAAANASGARPPDDAYQHGLQQMEAVYAQRLERHRRALLENR